MVTQRNACFGSWKCGKVSAFTTFPQPLFLLFLIKLTEKITQKEDEDCAERTNSIPTPVSEDLTNILLTIPSKMEREKMPVEEKERFKHRLAAIINIIEDGI